MRPKPCVLFTLLLLFQGCVYIHQHSGTANTNEIRLHLTSQLHCQTLELSEISRDRFSGTGRNDTGEFTIEVQREGEQIKFHGIYTEPAEGTFSGSASWNKSASGFLGLHKSKMSEQNSLGTP
jgi:hypothetical protein